MTSNPNPYQRFFDVLDSTIADINAGNAAHVAKETVDLLTRAGYVIANLLNAQSQLYPHLILDPEPAPTEAEEPSESPAQ